RLPTRIVHRGLPQSPRLRRNDRAPETQVGDTALLSERTARSALSRRATCIHNQPPAGLSVPMQEKIARARVEAHDRRIGLERELVETIGRLPLQTSDMKQLFAPISQRVVKPVAFTADDKAQRSHAVLADIGPH